MEQRSAEAVSSRQEKLLQLLKNFSLMDDDFMTKVFEDTACAELLLRIILERSDLAVQSVETQYTMKNLQGRSVRLDIYAVDADGQRSRKADARLLLQKRGGNALSCPCKSRSILQRKSEGSGYYV